MRYGETAPRWHTQRALFVPVTGSATSHVGAQRFNADFPPPLPNRKIVKKYLNEW